MSVLVTSDGTNLSGESSAYLEVSVSECNRYPTISDWDRTPSPFFSFLLIGKKENIQTWRHHPYLMCPTHNAHTHTYMRIHIFQRLLLITNVWSPAPFRTMRMTEPQPKSHKRCYMQCNPTFLVKTCFLMPTRVLRSPNSGVSLLTAVPLHGSL